MVNKRKGLGRGLDAMLNSNNLSPVPTRSASDDDSREGSRNDGMRHVPVDLIVRSPYQPRIHFDQAALEELAASISSQGVIQPLVVRRRGEKYELIAGERRWRAAQLATLEKVPVVINDVEDHVAMAMALIENIQRENLSPLEEAMGLQRLIEEFGLTHQKAAEIVGRSRASVSNMLRLMDLNDEVKALVNNGSLDMGHARALLSLPDARQLDAARQVISRQLSVRQTEALVRQMLQPTKPPVEKPQDPNVQRLQSDLSERLGADVAIQGSGKKGKLVIKYNSLDELDGILKHIQ